MSKRKFFKLTEREFQVQARLGRYRDHRDEPDWEPWGPLTLQVQYADDRICGISVKNRNWAEYAPQQGDRHGQTFEAEGYYLELAEGVPQQLGLNKCS
jgi:hypothetical protein